MKTNGHRKSRRGAIRMIDVGDKPVTARMATAVGRITLNKQTFAAILSGGTAKGDVLAAAHLAAIMGAKRTAEIIPLCHPLPVSGIDVRIEPDKAEQDAAPKGERAAFRVSVTVRTEAKTGVEMEALMGVSAALLTIYDMSKGMDKTMVLDTIQLVEKRGGRSGTFRLPVARRRGGSP